MLTILLKGAKRSRTYSQDDIEVRVELDPPNGDERAHLSASRFSQGAPRVGDLFDRVSVSSVRSQGAEDVADQMEAYKEDAAGRAFGRCVKLVEGVNFEGAAGETQPEVLLYHHGPDWLLRQIVRDLLNISQLDAAESGNLNG
jgi:hypothetical protein